MPILLGITKCSASYLNTIACGNENADHCSRNAVKSTESKIVMLKAISKVNLCEGGLENEKTPNPNYDL